MKIVASVVDPVHLDAAVSAGATFIELRLDLMEGDVAGQVEFVRKHTDIPLIATLRSATEGGGFRGGAEEWLRIVDPIVRNVDMVDMEVRFQDHAPDIKAHGVQIIASLHTAEMPSPPELAEIEHTLRSYGDIPKIAVKPRTVEDVITLLSYTHLAQKPICISILGSEFRFARALLPLFGSEFTFGHVGTPTAEGQYHVSELKQLEALLQ